MVRTITLKSGLMVRLPETQPARAPNDDDNDDDDDGDSHHDDEQSQDDSDHCAGCGVQASFEYALMQCGLDHKWYCHRCFPAVQPANKKSRTT